MTQQEETETIRCYRCEWLVVLDGEEEPQCWIAHEVLDFPICRWAFDRNGKCRIYKERKTGGEKACGG